MFLSPAQLSRRKENHWESERSWMSAFRLDAAGPLRSSILSWALTRTGSRSTLLYISSVEQAYKSWLRHGWAFGKTQWMICSVNVPLTISCLLAEICTTFKSLISEMWTLVFAVWVLPETFQLDDPPFRCFRYASYIFFLFLLIRNRFISLRNF